MISPHPNIWFPYAQMQNLQYIPKAVKTSGSKIYLENNQVLIDGISSWWTACHGYNNQTIVKSIIDQAKKMPHIMFGGFSHFPAEELTDNLLSILSNKYKHIFYVDSGSVGIEVSMKMAVQFWLNIGIKGKNKFISFKNAYHGDTLGAMSVCDLEEGMHSLFKGYISKQLLAEIPSTMLLKEKFEKFVIRHKSKVAAIILEPLVQCAGGMKMHSADVVTYISRIAKKHKILFILDEIATGFGRTGTMFAYEQTYVRSDILCLGKALTGGTMSLAAVVASSEIYKAFLSSDFSKALMHGPTYMANPLACAAANASIKIFKNEPRLDQVLNIEKLIKARVNIYRKLPGVVDVRVKGAVGVIQLEKIADLNWLRNRFIEKGVWIRPFLDVIYIMPCFTIKDHEINRLLDAIEEIIPEWADKFYKAKK
ncbi:MAG: Adenosylmethionine-8-amino-7-oxononanoate aminotransferase [Alphaproteobacteria bacterium MarineAlpha9_Bin2]|nr:MAG: Adenosylmethionine-8-amino-7-oxononanoate aminotransferase [Alphaproteobacteria bacterium MarineAlpha9_Bin2]PPR29945.1 MAG: Adenosylmethionine-8-amino-7-oxononanoate aminotransferase [Alphaproteobacteria bacterium MarineAlpha9_Bin1]